MKMTPPLLIVGSLLVFWSSVFVAVFLPALTTEAPTSDIWRPWTEIERAGHELYVANGCSYCHSLFVRTMDWDLGAERIADKGDYVGQEPAILGTERIGPDLSQEGGEHPDDWQLAHFVNPRYTRPMSLMPSWEFLGSNRIAALTAFVQAQGGRKADFRVERQRHWKAQALAATRARSRRERRMAARQCPRRMAGDAESLSRDRGGPGSAERGSTSSTASTATGRSATARDRRRNTSIRRRSTSPRCAATWWSGKYIGGIFYYQIMNGITGTGMPYFKRELESEKIWDVSNYLAVQFVGYTDAGIEPRGIPAAYEPAWTNTYKPPDVKQDVH